MRAVASIKHRVTHGAKGNVHEIEVHLWDKRACCGWPADTPVPQASSIGWNSPAKNGNAIDLQYRVDGLTDDDLKTSRRTDPKF